MNKFASQGAYRWVVLVLVMVGMFMAILDSSIVNVALPHMMSTFGVNRDQIEWVVTAFMLATAVAMPLVGWLVGRLGHKALYLGALAMFTLSSAACAVAWSYDALIAARVVQALGGGAIQPVSMAIVAELFEPHERGKALGIWGTGIMIGPAIGPTLGGYLTDWFNWRMIFSVNIPIGLITLLVGLAVMKSEKSHHRARIPLDTWGFVLLSLALTAGLLALSQGEEKGWDSTYVRVNLALSIASAVLFVAIEASVAHPLLDLALFRVRNFTLGMVLALFRAVGLFGGVFLLPIFLENLAGYTTVQTGLWMMPGAVAVGIFMPIAGKLADRYTPRWLVVFGTFLTGISMFFYGYLDPLSGAGTIIGPQVVRGAGLAFMMTPLLTTAINSVPPARVAMASSFLNVAQRVGGSFDIAFLNTYVTAAIHTHAVRIGSLMGAQSPAFRRFTLLTSGVDLPHVPGLLLSPSAHGLVLSARAILHRASILGFDNGFVLAGLVVLAGVPLSMLLAPDEHHVRQRGLAAK